MSHSIRLHSVCYCTVVKQITDADENDICSVEVENVGPTLGGVITALQQLTLINR